MTLSIYAECDSIKNFVQQVDGYIVKHCKQGAAKSFQYDFQCTCPNFTANPYTYCKHIKQVHKDLCDWNQLIHGGKPLLIDSVWHCSKTYLLVLINTLSNLCTLNQNLL